MKVCHIPDDIQKHQSFSLLSFSSKKSKKINSVPKERQHKNDDKNSKPPDDGMKQRDDSYHCAPLYSGTMPRRTPMKGRQSYTARNSAIQCIRANWRPSYFFLYCSEQTLRVAKPCEIVIWRAQEITARSWKKEEATEHSNARYKVSGSFPEWREGRDEAQNDFLLLCLDACCYAHMDEAIHRKLLCNPRVPWILCVYIYVSVHHRTHRKVTGEEGLMGKENREGWK